MDSPASVHPLPITQCAPTRQEPHPCRVADDPLAVALRAGGHHAQVVVDELAGVCPLGWGVGGGGGVGWEVGMM